MNQIQQNTIIAALIIALWGWIIVYSYGINELVITVLGLMILNAIALLRILCLSRAVEKLQKQIDEKD